MSWTPKRLRESRAMHRAKAEAAAVEAKRYRQAGIHQRGIARKRTRQLHRLLNRPSAARRRIVAEAEKAAANYRKNPSAYHYLAGGVANTIYLSPTPRNYRSDCSQFVAAVYKGAGLPSPADPTTHEFASTYSIVKSPRARLTSSPKPGDLGLYGDRSGPLSARNTHHVELVTDVSPIGFIGHGSPPIDSLTPGFPDFYVTFDFLG